MVWSSDLVKEGLRWERGRRGRVGFIVERRVEAAASRLPGLDFLLNEAAPKVIEVAILTEIEAAMIQACAP